MDIYIKTLSNIKNSSWSIIKLDSDSIGDDYNNTIVILPDVYNKCPQITELNNVLNKRLSDIHERAVAICCICSYGYTVNNLSLNSVSYTTFLSIWGHIEILQKSASPSLRAWITESIDRRSQDGYSIKFGEPRKSNEKLKRAVMLKRQRFDVKLHRLGTVQCETYFGDIHNMKDIISQDWVILLNARMVCGESVADAPIGLLESPV